MLERLTWRVLGPEQLQCCFIAPGRDGGSCCSVDSTRGYRKDEEGVRWLGSSVNPSLFFDIRDAEHKSRVGKLIDLIPADSIVGSLKVLESPLKSWVHKDGRIALVGDACHPMLVGGVS